MMKVLEGKRSVLDFLTKNLVVDEHNFLVTAYVPLSLKNRFVKGLNKQYAYFLLSKRNVKHARIINLLKTQYTPGFLIFKLHSKIILKDFFQKILYNKFYSFLVPGITVFRLQGGLYFSSVREFLYLDQFFQNFLISFPYYLMMILSVYVKTVSILFILLKRFITIINYANT